MHATPLPDSWEGVRWIIGPEDPTRDDMRACEYAVRPSHEYPGRPRVMVRLELNDDDRAILTDGGVVWLELDGAEVPWSITVTDVDHSVPD